MKSMFLRFAILILVSMTLQAQKPAPSKERDLTLESLTPSSVPATDPVRPHIPRSYALVVGVSNYQNLPDAQQLPYSNRDAEAIYSVLISPEGGNFPAENVHKLIGSAATLSNIKQNLEEWLPASAKKDDRVLIYFAGHGFVDPADGTAYLAPYDFRKNDIVHTGYAMSRLSSVIGSAIQAKDKILLTDSCHSGAISPDADVQRINQSLSNLDKSLFSLTASRDRERSFEGKDWGGGHGVFTYYVIEGLKGAADTSHDGIVTADELAEYVHTNVREATQGKQNPTSERASFDPNMLLSYVPANVRPGTPPPPKFGTLVFESNMDGVEILIDGQSKGIVNKSAPLSMPGLPPGAHIVQGVHIGYEPDGPREEVVYPGQEKTVTIRILIQKRRSRAAADHLDKALKYYQNGQEKNYKAAQGELREAIAIDPNYSQAWLYMGRVSSALFDREDAEKAFRRAIQIDPDYLEARTSLGGMLLDKGDLDEAVRQLNVVTQREPKNAEAWYLLSQAFTRKESYEQASQAAAKAIDLTPRNAEAHFWMAESLRFSKQWEPARNQYDSYLKLSNFDSGTAGKLNYYVLGYLIGLGKKSRASQEDIWKDLRSWAYFGLCDCERRLSHFDAAINDCQKSLAYDNKDPLAHYALGLAYLKQGQSIGNVGPLVAACDHFKTMIGLNASLAEAEYAKKNIAGIQKLVTCQ